MHRGETALTNHSYEHWSSNKEVLAVRLESRYPINVQNPKVKSYFKMRTETLRTMSGPATYTLPPEVGHENQDITRNRNLAYKIGMKAQEFVKRGPDPCYIKPGLTLFEKANLAVHTMKENV
jgi:hypothetical protein